MGIGSFIKKHTGFVGGLGGGAAIGAAIGTLLPIPVVGTLAGGAIGGAIAGGFGGAMYDQGSMNIQDSEMSNMGWPARAWYKVRMGWRYTFDATDPALNDRVTSYRTDNFLQQGDYKGAIASQGSAFVYKFLTKLGWGGQAAKDIAEKFFEWLYKALGGKEKEFIHSQYLTADMKEAGITQADVDAANKLRNHGDIGVNDKEIGAAKTAMGDAAANGVDVTGLDPKEVASNYKALRMAVKERGGDPNSITYDMVINMEVAEAKAAGKSTEKTTEEKQQTREQNKQVDGSDRQLNQNHSQGHSRSKGQDSSGSDSSTSSNSASQPAGKPGNPDGQKINATTNTLVADQLANGTPGDKVKEAINELQQKDGPVIDINHLQQIITNPHKFSMDTVTDPALVKAAASTATGSPIIGDLAGNAAKNMNNDAKTAGADMALNGVSNATNVDNPLMNLLSGLLGGKEKDKGGLTHTAN